MKKTIQKGISIIFGCTFLCTIPIASQNKLVFEEQPPFDPPQYVCYRTPGTITVDGKLSPGEWDAIPVFSAFGDLMGHQGPKPHLQTIVKMAHDDQGLYIGAWLEEPHIWATITQHDVAIYQENAFEIFFDMTNDTHHYLEYQVNALGSTWDLYLNRPYRDNPITLSDWEFMGMQSKVFVDGTLNDPSDVDKGWSAELFIPWKSLYQMVPQKRRPADGDQIRANFMRVQWPLDIKDGKYSKKPAPEGQRFAESYWLWSPIGRPSIHLPEYWGYVQFSEKVAGKETVSFAWNNEEDIKRSLRHLYYRMAEYKRAIGHFPNDLKELAPEDVCPSEMIPHLSLHTTPTLWEIIYAPAEGKSLFIRYDGLTGGR